MKPILHPEYRPVLQRFLTRNTVMAFDYDGTLAPMVNDPGRAEMRPATQELLRRVAMLYPTVVISGRQRSDIRRYLQGIPLLEVIGNHGIETPGAAPARITRRVAEWRRELEQRLQSMEGIVLEDKRYSLSIHYRQSSDRSAETTIRRQAEQLAGARLIGGKFVLNVVPGEAPGKGTALLRLCERLGATRAVFVGDDDTDEDVFAIDRSDTVLGIRVGRADDTAAAYFVDDQDDVDRLLQAMVAGVRGARPGRNSDPVSTGA